MLAISLSGIGHRSEHSLLQQAHRKHKARQGGLQLITA